jgi:hypothetical protein
MLEGGVKKERGCEVQTTAKYANRNSPSYPANECCGERKRGNDGMMYVSSRVGNQKSCTWKKVDSAKESSPAKGKTEARSKSPSKSSLEDMTVPALVALCRERGIKKYSGLRKAELIAHIRKHR